MVIRGKRETKTKIQTLRSHKIRNSLYETYNVDIGEINSVGRNLVKITLKEVMAATAEVLALRVG